MEHAAPLILRQNSCWHLVSRLAPSLDADCPETSLQLNPGDALILLSGGAVEAQSETVECLAGVLFLAAENQPELPL